VANDSRRTGSFGAHETHQRCSPAALQLPSCSIVGTPLVTSRLGWVKQGVEVDQLALRGWRHWAPGPAGGGRWGCSAARSRTNRAAPAAVRRRHSTSSPEHLELAPGDLAGGSTFVGPAFAGDKGVSASPSAPAGPLQRPPPPGSAPPPVNGAAASRAGRLLNQGPARPPAPLSRRRSVPLAALSTSPVRGTARAWRTQGGGGHQLGGEGLILPFSAPAPLVPKRGSMCEPSPRPPGPLPLAAIHLQKPSPGNLAFGVFVLVVGGVFGRPGMVAAAPGPGPPALRPCRRCRCGSVKAGSPGRRRPPGRRRGARLPPVACLLEQLKLADQNWRPPGRTLGRRGFRLLYCAAPRSLLTDR